ncbi:MAG: flagellar hook-basal body complex protein [Proteobacteria bacterium]|nr:flagellar hook-basal body complex protein [Pseudomonadota bacterium]MBS0572869.1 flagellar hook-basal body complex protein [Pseudomonadota bacterium]
MDNGIYTTLNRQSGLMQEMQVVANNIANMSTTGFRREGVIFAEHVADLRGNEPSLSMASAEGRAVNLSQGVLQETGGRFDLAIEGEGFFMVQTPEGNQLTRAGAFTPSADGTLVTAEGHPVLDSGGSPIAVPPGVAQWSVARDGTISADGQPVAQVGLYRPASPADLTEAGGTRFRTSSDPQPLEGGHVFQGFLEGSNVNPVAEITRMIAVQRAYEMGQGFLDAEDGRIRSVVQTIGR